MNLRQALAEIERLNDVIAALDAEVEALQSDLLDVRADLAREIGRSHGMARWGCPQCPPGEGIPFISKVENGREVPDDCHKETT